MADKPQIDARAVYGVVADTMPMEGRDFVLDTAYDENKKPKLMVRPLSDIGRAFAPILTANLAKAMAGAGVSVSENGAAAQEVVTVNLIRKKAEQEALAAHEARIASAEADFKAKKAAQEAAYKARVAKSGERAPFGEEEMTAMRAAEQAARGLRRMRQITKKLQAARADVDSEALKEAQEDAKNGRDWSVDADAPLTSLFDRQDAENKFKRREELVLQMAAHAADYDELRYAAASYTKQYVLPKKPAQAGK